MERSTRVIRGTSQVAGHIGVVRTTDYREVIRTSAACLRELKTEIDRTFKAQPHGPDHHAACAAFHSQFDTLAFPGGLNAALDKLKAGEPSVVDIAVQYLEVEPTFFRSGYIAETILRRLKHVSLTRDQVTRLVYVILNSVRHGGRRRFANCARLARALKDQRITAGASVLSRESDPEIKRRAQRLLEALAAPSGTEVPNPHERRGE
jgi:hypothetical protein